ncbi:hypothetical protein MPL1032_180138 [Mesorhizobium plurifarium]|uniref:Uncharacterized protein n=1 Tax=Mesorhizobium plurifarium TaxID=69974 RepID=A0A0K2VTK1_MESPL|nr:hypothetical protein MPL1032_180138 [Mesorhizobium plurifarium]
MSDTRHSISMRLKVFFFGTHVAPDVAERVSRRMSQCSHNAVPAGIRPSNRGIPVPKKQAAPWSP